MTGEVKIADNEARIFVDQSEQRKVGRRMRDGGGGSYLKLEM